MSNYFKATRPDGTDLRTGTIDYAAALASGEVVRHPAKRVKDQPSTYLSVSVAPADCTGFSWPCRLFRVKPVGRTLRATNLPNKRACSALRVIEELPAHMAFGPNGEAVVALIERTKRLTPDEGRSLAAAWAAAWDAAVVATWDAAAAAARDRRRAAARRRRRRSPPSPPGTPPGRRRAAAWAAAGALIVRDRIPPEQFDVLYGPWASVMEQGAVLR